MRPIRTILLALLCLATKLQAQQDWQLDTLYINGIRQVTATKGNPKGPILLFLHGGPGSSRMKQADLICAKLQKDFLIIQWDQRESGKTQVLNKTNIPITLNLMVRDTQHLIDSLLQKHKQQKLYLAGESWGTVLGFHMAKNIPQKLHAYLAFAAVTHQDESERQLLQLLKNEAQQKSNTLAQTELNTIKIPFENSDDIYYLRKWWFHHEGTPIPDNDTTAVKQYLKSWSDTWLNTWRAAMAQNLSKQLPKLDCPIYFFLGGKDYQTNSQLAKAHYEKLKAPKKKLYWFDSASHDLLVTEREKIQPVVLKEILRQ